MLIKSLQGISQELIYQAFVAAFSDYEVQINMTYQKLLEMMKVRDLRLEYSLGCFDNDQLVGFIITGYREIGGKKCCYDGGTGIIKDYRQQGLGSKLLKSLIEILEDKDLDCFILEVLENNLPAIKLYEKMGFKKTRRLKCYQLSKSVVSDWNIDIDGFEKFDHLISNYQGLDISQYLGYKPSWQNDKVSIENTIENYEYLALLINNQVIAYGLIHYRSGDVPQIGVLGEYNDQGIEGYVLKRIANKTESDKLILLNIPEDNYLCSKLEELGFNNFVNQYEMVLEF